MAYQPMPPCSVRPQASLNCNIVPCLPRLPPGQSHTFLIRLLLQQSRQRVPRKQHNPETRPLRPRTLHQTHRQQLIRKPQANRRNPPQDRKPQPEPHNQLDRLHPRQGPLKPNPHRNPLHLRRSPPPRPDKHRSRPRRTQHRRRGPKSQRQSTILKPKVRSARAAVTSLVGPLAARSWGLRLALGLEIERHCRADEVLQGRLIDLLAFVDVDGAPDIPFEAGVE